MSNGVASAGTSSGSSTNTNSASGSMKRRIEPGAGRAVDVAVRPRRPPHGRPPRRAQRARRRPVARMLALGRREVVALADPAELPAKPPQRAPAPCPAHCAVATAASSIKARYVGRRPRPPSARRAARSCAADAEPTDPDRRLTARLDAPRRRATRAAHGCGCRAAAPPARRGAAPPRAASASATARSEASTAPAATGTRTAPTGPCIADHSLVLNRGFVSYCR